MKCSLTIYILVLIAMVAIISTAQASWLSELLWGRHYDLVEPGIRLTIDEQFPKAWAQHTDLMFRYHKQTDRVFAGTKLTIGVTIDNKSMKEATFAICITDPKMVNADYSGSLNFKLPERKGQIGGLKVLGTFRGLYGEAEFVTDEWTKPGSRQLYILVDKNGKYIKATTKIYEIKIAPPLDQMVDSLQGVPEETLRSWGFYTSTLESLPTMDQSNIRVGDLQKSCRYDIVFADKVKIENVKIQGKACAGRVLGVFSLSALEGIVKIDDVRGNTLYSSTRSDFIQALDGKECELIYSWVVRVRKYADSSEKRPLTARQKANLSTYPAEMQEMMQMMAETSVGTIAKSDGTVILTDSVVHLQVPFQKNTSGMYKFGFQVWSSQHEHWVTAPQEQEAYVCERDVQAAPKCLRVIKLAVNGDAVVIEDEAKITAVDRPGLWPGIAYIIGQAVHRPDRINVAGGAGGHGGNVGDITNNNSNANTNVNDNNNVINIGEGYAEGKVTGNGSSDAFSGDIQGGQ